jgi:hypothetical protein
LLKLVDVVVDCGFLVLLEICEIIGGADVFEVGRAAVFSMESFPDGCNIVLDVV